MKGKIGRTERGLRNTVSGWSRIKGSMSSHRKIMDDFKAATKKQ